MKWAGRQIVSPQAKDDIGDTIENVLKTQVVDHAIANGHTPIGEPEANWHLVEEEEILFYNEHIQAGDWDLRVWVRIEDE
jgi:hypothetical protein